MVNYPKFSVLKPEYGPVNGKSIKEYHEVVHWGWYVVKATRVDMYLAPFTDDDEEGTLVTGVPYENLEKSEDRKKRSAKPRASNLDDFFFCGSKSFS